MRSYVASVLILGESDGDGGSVLVQADARWIPLADGSVQCCVTSPPYWSLRDYGLGPSIFGGNAECEHIWGKERLQREEGGWHRWKPNDGREHNTIETRIDPESKPSQGSFCQLCGAWKGNLGLEPTPELYVQHMVEIFREVKRVLRDDGTCWVNLGDSYAHSGACGGSSPDGPRKPRAQDRRAQQQMSCGIPPGLKPKDLVGIPWRVAFALQADGWWLRSDIIWHKPNPMPESVTDRPTKSHEYLFLLTKSKRYYYDTGAIREPQKRDWSKEVWAQQRNYGAKESSMGQEHGGNKTIAETYNPAGRNCRTVWTIPTRPYSGAHFATYPPALVEPCILAGTSAKGACPVCGSPWKRVVEKTRTFESGSGKSGNPPNGKNGERLQGGGETLDIRRGPCVQVKTTGWRPTCEHDTEPIPCLVLDPFCGSGTTGMVAIKHGREFMGLDLNGDYLHKLAKERLDKVQIQLC